jgi:hypothetical protein
MGCVLSWLVVWKYPVSDPWYTGTSEVRDNVALWYDVCALSDPQYDIILDFACCLSFFMGLRCLILFCWFMWTPLGPGADSGMPMRLYSPYHLLVLLVLF